MISDTTPAQRPLVSQHAFIMIPNFFLTNFLFICSLVCINSFRRNLNKLDKTLAYTAEPTLYIKHKSAVLLFIARPKRVNCQRFQINVSKQYSSYKPIKSVYDDSYLL